MIRCVIIEDEPLAKQLLERYVTETEGLELVGYAEDAEQAFDLINEKSPDLLFLDIQLPGLTGLNFYKSLIHKPKVIFTTAYPDHAVEGFELEAVDYLLKPFSYERFVKATMKAKSLLDTAKSDDVIIIKEDKKSYRVPLDQLLHIESIGDYVKVYTTDKTYLSSDTLKSLETQLPHPFMRVHKSFIVNMDQVAYLEGNRLKIQNTMVPIGYAYRESVSKLFKK
ncbi:LytR/AlgR family response regulator transcription factor [Marinoscillum sp.]|uniref:LytR/AlgR family response regulator transcription factor n=1 Tax=Marinoscillum sp. TaxID=2024838 RepID=UPI003BA968F8